MGTLGWSAKQNTNTKKAKSASELSGDEVVCLEVLSVLDDSRDLHQKSKDPKKAHQIGTMVGCVMSVFAIGSSFIITLIAIVARRCVVTRIVARTVRRRNL